MLNIAAAKRSEKRSAKLRQRRKRHGSSNKVSQERRAHSTAAFGATPDIYMTREQSRIQGCSTSTMIRPAGTQIALLDDQGAHDPLLELTERIARQSKIKTGTQAEVVAKEYLDFAARFDGPLVGSGLLETDREHVRDMDAWLGAYEAMANKKEQDEQRELDRSEQVAKAAAERTARHGCCVGFIILAAQYVWSRTIYPDSLPVRAWELAMVAFVLYNAIVLPFTLAFWGELGVPPTVETLDLVSDIFFWADLVQNFWKAYVDEFGMLRTSKRAIAREYLSTWFLVDLLACLPLEFLLPERLVTASNMAKCVRLLRLAKIMRFLDKLEFGSAMRIIRLLVGVLLLCHWIACFWFFIGSESLDAAACYAALGAEVPTTSRLSHEALRSCSWLVLKGLDSPDIPTTSKYLKAMHWSITTVMTVGYGEFRPVNLTELGFYTFVIATGAGAYANLFSIIVRVIESADSVNNQYAVLVEEVGAQMKYLRFPDELRQKVFGYYQYLFMRQRHVLDGRDPFYHELPESTASDITSYLFLDQVRHVYFLCDCSHNFLLALASRLRVMVCIPDERIINEGDHSDGWFIISAGECAVLKRTGEGDKERRVRLLGPGDHFGEIGMLTGNNRSATVKALSFGDLQYVTMDVFYDLVRVYEADNDQLLTNVVGKLTPYYLLRGGHLSDFVLASEAVTPMEEQRRRSSISMDIERIQELRKAQVAATAGAEAAEEEEEEEEAMVSGMY